MTWTDEDMRDLRAIGADFDRMRRGDRITVERAADEIERLQKRVAEFERNYECHPNGGMPGCDCWERLRAKVLSHIEVRHG